MPKSIQDDDLFKDSTMTFGEHLEDLRGCLFRAVAGLLVGVLVGLFVGSWVVQLIQSPLSQALTTYYQDESVNIVKKKLLESEAGQRLFAENPTKFNKLVAAVAWMVQNEGVLPDFGYVSSFQSLDSIDNAVPPELDESDPRGEGAKKALEARVKAIREAMVPTLVWHPTENDPRIHAKTFNAQEPFVIWIKASLLVGVVLASPWIFYQVWSFVAAGLYPHEKHYVNIFLPFSLALFLLGASVAFFFVFKPVLGFLLSFNRSLGMSPEPRITEWLGFVLLLPLGFGIAFQLPLVMLFLERIGLVTAKMYLSYWRVAILAIFVIAAILTPPDPMSMTMLALPLSLLYFGGIALCKLMPKGPGLRRREQ